MPIKSRKNSSTLDTSFASFIRIKINDLESTMVDEIQVYINYMNNNWREYPYKIAILNRKNINETVLISCWCLPY